MKEKNVLFGSTTHFLVASHDRLLQFQGQKIVIQWLVLGTDLFCERHLLKFQCAEDDETFFLHSCNFFKNCSICQHLHRY